MVYMITYDLNESGQNYDKVIEAIKFASSGVWCSYWKSSWLIHSYLPTSDAVYELIDPYIDGNDSIIVIEVKNNKQGWLEDGAWEIINKMF